ncbi:MAG: APC family permease [Pirellulales bacterium]
MSASESGGAKSIPDDSTETQLAQSDSHGGQPALADSTGHAPDTQPQAKLIEGVVDPQSAPASLPRRVKTFLIGRPRDLNDRRVFHHVSLIAFLAWVGLGADGLSSSCYGPAEAFHHLGEHAYLAIFLSLATITTVAIISACYSHIIEEFPSGGGGYLVASKLLGAPAGVLSGSALLVDYVLTITVSIAAAGDALFGLLPNQFQGAKMGVEIAAIVLLIVLNLRGIKESVTFLLPIFLVFLVTHAILITGSVGMHLGAAGEVVRHVTDSIRTSAANPSIGPWGLFGIFLYAYSLGAGTYTGIEAVSNSMPVMREPRVATAKKTMVYMALSLAFTAGGLMIAYLLLGIRAAPDRTMNQVLTETFVGDIGFGESSFGSLFVWTTIISEGALLFVAAQAGFIDGPRVLANMAQDSFVPHWLGNLSERLSTHNGIMLMGIAALAALLYTGGNVTTLIIMYSINVFLTFSLSMVGMCRYWWDRLSSRPEAKRRLALFLLGAALCLCILGVTVYEKFSHGGYVTLAVTGLCVAACFVTRKYYDSITRKIQHLNSQLSDPPTRPEDLVTAEPDPKQPTAIILVGGYSGLGVHTLMNALRYTPGYFKNIVFVSVGVVDSGNFKGEQAMEDLKLYTESTLSRYVDLANRLGFPSTSFMAIGTDPVDELEHLCIEVHKKFPRSIIFAGQLVFNRDTIYQRLFHNQTAFSLQRRLQWDGVPMMILPTRIR